MNDLAVVGDDEPTLRDEISAAMEAEAPLVEAPEAAAPEAAPTGRSRDPAGRFAPSSEPTQDPPEPDAPPAAGEPAPAQTIAPPASWSATAKARFESLDPVVQREVLKREKDIEQGKAQWDQKGERLNRLDSVLGPRRERFQLAGIDDARAIEALFAAQDLLERDPVNALAYLARHYGVDLRQFAQSAPGQAAQPPMPEALQRLSAQVNSLQGALAQQRSQAHQAVRSQYASEVEAFRADPKSPYFETVKADMAALLRTGRASTLQDAYDKAVWANLETRPLVLKGQEDQRRAEAEATARAKASAARHASGSITGSPRPGSSPANAGPAPTLRDELARAFSEAS